MFLLMFAVACTPQLQEDENGEAVPDPEEEPEAVAVAEYETFDPSPYETEPPRSEVEVEHDVPERLLQGRADEGVTRTVEGYRIQIYSSQSRSAADDVLQAAQDWWTAKYEDNDEAPIEVFGEELPADLEFGQPYYRVRIGSFVDRDEAEEALDVVQDEYDDAFIVRSTVTVTR